LAAAAAASRPEVTGMGSQESESPFEGMFEDEDTAGGRVDRDAGELPEHELDELRRMPDEQQVESDPAAREGLPEHEQDRRRGDDTSGQQNP
jgi:hypothetical protein